MKFKLLLFFNSILLLNTINCEEEISPRVLNRRTDYDAQPSIEQQTIQEYSQNSTVRDASFDDVIDEIIDSSRQGRNIDGLDEVYSDPTVKQALLSGDDTQARNLIRDKLCDLGLMECEKRAPVRYIYTQPPNQSPVYHQRPVQSRPPPPPPQVNGPYGQPRPVPLPGQQHQQQFQQSQQSQQQFQQAQQSFQQPPRKVGYAPSNLNSFHASKPISDKYSTEFFELDQAQSGVKFGYTEKPTIILNQGKREAVSQNHHVHHHYVHVDGTQPVDGGKIVVNAPISEYSAVNSLSGSYQTSGFGATGSGINSGAFAPTGSDFEYKGVNSGSQGVYGLSSNVKPVFESSSQYGSGNYNQQVQKNPNVGPAVFTDGANGIYSNVGQSYHSSAPDFYKKELNINGNRGNSLSGSNYLGGQQNQQNQQFTQKYSKNQYNQGEAYQGFESARQDQYDCVCVPFDQCPAHDVVGRRDDLILPLDPRNLPTEIEADGDNSTSIRVVIDANAPANSTEVKKISKRQVNDVQKVEGEGVSIQKNLKRFLLFKTSL